MSGPPVTQASQVLLLEGLFSGNTYVSLRFDGKVIEIFNSAKKDNIRKKNWDFISDILRDVIK